MADPPEELEHDDGAWSPTRVWNAIRQRWLLVASITAVLTIAVAFYTLGQPKIYQTSASVLIDPNPPRPLGKDVQSAIDVGSGVYWTNKEYYETQFYLIRSRRVALETVKTLGLNRDPTFMSSKATPGTTGPQASPEAAAAVLLSRLTAEPVKNTRLLTVTYEDTDPARARKVLSTLLDIYIQQNLDDALAATGSAADWMRGQLEKLKRELEKNELALHEYKRDKRILSVSLDDQSNMLRDEMSQLNQELTKIRTDRERIEARSAELDKVDPSDPEFLPASELLNSTIITDLRSSYVEAKKKRDSLMGEGKGQNHPDVQAADASAATARKALMAEVKNVQASLRRDLDAAKRQERGLSKLYEASKQRALDLNLLEIHYRRLERNKKNTERLFSIVLERSKDSDLTSQMRFNNIRVVDAAPLPKVPVRPSIPLNLAGGLAAGLVLGLAAAMSREMLDRTIKSPGDLERELGTTYLGMLPRIALNGANSGSGYGRRKKRKVRHARDSAAPELMVHADPKSGIAEAARAIRTNILFMSPDEACSRLLITSAMPSEGKTTVACSVAIAMANAGQRVLLLDCDLRRPRLHQVFGEKNDVGVTSLLLAPDAIATSIRATGVPNLDLLTSGPIPPNPAELLHSEAFGKLLEELTARYDLIVVDSPPLVPVTDAAVLSTRVDATLLVVKPHRTRKELARHGVRALRDVGGRILGCVLNDVDMQQRSYGYYYSGYAYRDGQYASQDESSDDKVA